jgi:hypothetical protein
MYESRCTQEQVKYCQQLLCRLYSLQRYIQRTKNMKKKELIKKKEIIEIATTFLHSLHMFFN